MNQCDPMKHILLLKTVMYSHTLTCLADWAVCHTGVSAITKRQMTRTYAHSLMSHSTHPQLKSVLTRYSGAMDALLALVTLLPAFALQVLSVQSAPSPWRLLRWKYTSSCAWASPASPITVCQNPAPFSLPLKELSGNEWEWVTYWAKFTCTEIYKWTSWSLNIHRWFC